MSTSAPSTEPATRLSDRLAGTVCVVTAGNQGLGRTITTRLAAHGAQVAYTGRSAESLTATTEALTSLGDGQHLPVVCDVTDESALTSLADTVLGHFGRVDAVVANAGISGPTKPMVELTLAEWRETQAVNLDGVFLTFRSFAPAMIKQRSGSLIAIGSIVGKRPLAGRTPYAAAKLGVVGLVRTLAAELGPHGVRVNTIAPGRSADPASTRSSASKRAPRACPRRTSAPSSSATHRCAAWSPSRRSATPAPTWPHPRRSPSPVKTSTSTPAWRCIETPSHTQRGGWPMNLAENLLTTAEAWPEAAALRLGPRTLSYQEFLDAARASAGWMREHGVRPGDRVGLIVPNVPAFPVLFYGALFAGAAVVSMNPLLSEREISFYYSDSGVEVAFAFQGLPDGGDSARAAAAATDVEVVMVGELGLSSDQLAQVPAMGRPEPRQARDLAVLLYTSGTTGRPKGAELTHHNLASNAAAVAGELLHTGNSDVIMGCLPLFHVFGLTCGLNTSVLTGSCLALLPRFDPVAALTTIQDHRVTVFEGVPTMYSALLHAPDAQHYDTSSLRACVSGGAALPVDVLHAFERQFNAMILEGYGLSETSPAVSFNHPDRPRKPGSIGTPMRGVEVRILDDTGHQVPPGERGELAVRGECVMRGYWGQPDATAEAIVDGWFRTGDIGRADDEGYLYIVDRKKQLIIRGGYNVYPREVEEVLDEHPAVAEAAVIGLQHPELGEEVGAAIALKPGCSATPDELRAFAKSRVAAYKYPRHVWIVETLPKGPTGKILHREISPPPDLVST